MINLNDIMETINMISEENLDIRTVTMGISLLDCADSDANLVPSSSNRQALSEVVPKSTPSNRLPILFFPLKIEVNVVFLFFRGILS